VPYRISKQVVDRGVAALLLCLLSLIFALAFLVLAADKWFVREDRGSWLYRERRISQGRQFDLLKFRVLKEEALARLRSAEGDYARLYERDEANLTAAGRLLKRMYLDELPQLVNILRGDMSLVGPRPEVPRYVELFHRDYEEILTVRPGITDLASLKYRDESGILAAAKDPEREYVARVLPEKIDLAKQYIREASFLFDLRLIFQTLLKVVVYG